MFNTTTSSNSANCAQYNSVGGWSAGDPIYETAFGISDECEDVDPVLVDLLQRGTTSGYSSKSCVFNGRGVLGSLGNMLTFYRTSAEHILERNTPARFFGDAAAGVLQSGATARFGSIDVSF